MIPEFTQGMKPFSQTEFRERLNEMVRVLNSLNGSGGLEFGQVFDSEDGSASPTLEFWIEILDHQDHTDRQWLYEWRAVYIDPEDPQGPLLPDPVIRWDGEVSPGVTYGLATNLAERESGLTLQRPMRTGSIVRAVLFIGANEEEEPVIQMAFSATNNERQFFATITGYTAGYYSWTECYANGDAIAGTDSPQSGTEAVNSYYGLSLLVGSPKIVPNGKVVMMEHLASDVMPDLVGFCVNMDAGVAIDVRGDEMVTAPATLPDPYPPTGGTLVGSVGAWIEVWKFPNPDSPGDFLFRVYHKPATVGDPSADYDCVEYTTTPGADDAGGGTGSVALTTQHVEVDAMGHQVETEDNPDVTFHARRHMRIDGDDTDIYIDHALQGPPILAYLLGCSDTPGGAIMSFPGFVQDNLGHITAAVDSSSVSIFGDEWVDVGSTTEGEIEIKHIGPVASDPGSTTLFSLSTPTFNPSTNSIEFATLSTTFDSKGHKVSTSEGEIVSIDMFAIIDAWWAAKTKTTCIPETP